MGRLPKVRASYRNDAMYMLRLAEAIDRDPKRTDEWKQESRRLLHQLVDRFNAATQEDIGYIASLK